MFRVYSLLAFLSSVTVEANPASSCERVVFVWDTEDTELSGQRRYRTHSLML